MPGRWYLLAINGSAGLTDATNLGRCRPAKGNNSRRPFYFRPLELASIFTNNHIDAPLGDRSLGALLNWLCRIYATGFDSKY